MVTLGRVVMLFTFPGFVACDDCAYDPSGWEPAFNVKVGWGVGEDPATVEGHHLYAVSFEPELELPEAVCLERTVNTIYLGTASSSSSDARMFQLMAPFRVPMVRLGIISSPEDRRVGSPIGKVWKPGETTFGVIDEVIRLLQIECTEPPGYITTSTGTYQGEVVLGLRAGSPCPSG